MVIRVAELNEKHFRDASRRFLQVLRNRVHRNFRGFGDGIAIDAGADGRKADGLRAVLVR